MHLRRMAVWRLASLLTLLTSPLLSPGEAKVVSEQAPAKEHQLEAAPYVGSYQVFKYRYNYFRTL